MEVVEHESANGHSVSSSRRHEKFSTIPYRRSQPRSTSCNFLCAINRSKYQSLICDVAHLLALIYCGLREFERESGKKAHRVEVCNKAALLMLICGKQARSHPPAMIHATSLPRSSTLALEGVSGLPDWMMTFPQELGGSFSLSHLLLNSIQ